MQRADYHLACHPDPVTILGVRVRPFTLGHAHLLARMESPFIADGEDGEPQPPAIGDVVLGVEICQRDYAAACAFLEQDNAARIIEKTARKWLKRNRAEDDVSPISEFIHYISHAAQGPRFWVEQKQAAKSGADWLQSLKLGLLKTGRSVAEAMDTPLGEAMWDYAAYWESEGAVKLHTDSDDALLEAVKQAKAGPCPEGMEPV